MLTPNIDKIRAELPIFLTGVIKVYGREGVPDIFQVKENSYHVDKLRIKSKKKLILFFKEGANPSSRVLNHSDAK